MYKYQLRIDFNKNSNSTLYRNASFAKNMEINIVNFMHQTPL